MKKLSFTFITLIIISGFGFTNNATAQQNITPPLLMQQNQPPEVPLPTEPPPPGTPEALPGSIPLPPGPAGISTVQTIPVQELLANLKQAVATAEKLNKLLTAGKIWIIRTPAGETEIKGGLLYQGAVLAVLHFNPVNGSILPLGIHYHTYQNDIRIQAIKSELSSSIGNLKILPNAEFIEPEACWSFPVVINSIIVAHIKVYYDGIHVVQDYVANQEMALQGQ